jgi:transposase-like protein
MPRSYPAEFRRKVLDLLVAGRSVAEIAKDLGISGACIYNWRKQDRIDRGELPGLTSPDRAELVAARRRINALEGELAAEPRAKQLLKEARPPNGRFAITQVMAAEAHSIKVSCHVLQSDQGGLLRVAQAPTVGAHHPPRVADGSDHQGPHRLARHIRRSPGSGRAHDHSREELRLEIVNWVERTYHRRRRQRGLGKLTPIEFEIVPRGRSCDLKAVNPASQPRRGSTRWIRRAMEHAS